MDDNENTIRKEACYLFLTSVLFGYLRYSQSKKGCNVVNKVLRQARTITMMAVICEEKLLLHKILPVNGNREEMFMSVSEAAARDTQELPPSTVVLDNVKIAIIVNLIQNCIMYIVSIYFFSDCSP